MAILEVGIIYKNTHLITKKFYNSTDVIAPEPEIRDNLLDAIFKGSFEKVSFGKYILLIQSLPLKITSDEEDEKIEKLFSLIPPLEKQPVENVDSETQGEDIQDGNTIQIYTLIEEQTSIDSVQKGMKELLFQFLNKYSIFDINQLAIKKFKGFSTRFADVFQDLVMNYSDRFKAIF